MTKVKREIEIEVADDPVAAVRWLKETFPGGVSLATEYQRERFAGHDYLDEIEGEAIDNITQHYLDDCGAVEATEEVSNAICEWCGDHDISKKS